MTPNPGLPPDALAIDDACERFEAAWRAGSPLRIEEILSSVSLAPEQAPQLFRELLLLEIELRAASGDRPASSDYTARFPQFATVIGEVFLESEATLVLPDRLIRAAAADPAEEISVVERYQIRKLLAEGGLGRIFRALDETFDREIALKEIKPERDTSDTRARFAREARLTAQLEHPGIVPVYGLGDGRQGRPFYLMRLIRGETLREAIARFQESSDHPDLSRHSMGLRDLLERFLLVCETINYAHSRGVVHRDIKPSNIMIGPFGETLVVDWGLAKVIPRADHSEATDAGDVLVPNVEDPFETSRGKALGTPHFMSPEQALGRHDLVGPASDIYSLGATLYDILAGRPPYADSASSEQVLRRVALGDFPAPRVVKPDIHPGLEAICLKAMSHQPSQRYSSPRALADDLRRWLADEPISAWREPRIERLRRAIGRHRVAFATSLGAFLVALLIGTPVYLDHVQAQAHALGLADAALRASAEELPGFINALGSDTTRVIDILLNRFRRGELPQNQRLRAGLVVGPGYADVRKYLNDQLLDSSIDFVPLILRELEGDAAPVSARLWRILEDPSKSVERRFRSAFALARLSPPRDPAAIARWSAQGEFIVATMLDVLSQDPMQFNLILQGFFPVRRPMFEALLERYRYHPTRGFDPLRIGRRTTAALFLDRYAESADDFAVLMLDTIPGPRLDRYLSKLRSLPDGSAALLRALDRDDSQIWPTDSTDPELTAGYRALREARLVAALLDLGETDSIWKRLRPGVDPTLRTELVANLPGSLEGKLEQIVKRLPEEPALEAQRDLLRCAGRLPFDTIPNDRRAGVRDALLRLYQETPDAGLHAQIGWNLRVPWGLQQEADRVDHAVASHETPVDRQWFVTPDLQTFTIFRKVGAVDIGSPASEPWRDDDEPVHEVRINRTFAIGCREVTVAEYRRFLDDFPQPARPLRIDGDLRFSNSDDAPVTGVSWLDAVRYCNWLSQKAGIPEAEWCYPTDCREGMSLDPSWLDRSGYRLPTEAEWEYACRARATTSRFFGASWDHADLFGWFSDNASGLFHPVGLKLPNDFGLFDTLGNAAEWTHDRYEPPAQAAVPAANGGNPTAEVFSGRDNRVVRGGSSFRPPRPRSASRDALAPGIQGWDVGFRVARTCP